MKVGILGAGPAGLYAAILIKRACPGASVIIYEQNPADATWGFGVVFSEKALEFLREDDPETANLIEPHMESWSEIRVTHQNTTVVIDGIGFNSIGRLRMLRLLQQRADEFQVDLIYNHRVDDLRIFNDCDFVIAADGVNSLVLKEAPQAFDHQQTTVGNWFCWYGVEYPFSALTQTFKTIEYGNINAHHYRYSPDLSTFIVECDESTFEKAGFSRMSEPEYRSVCESVFADTLKGRELINNHSIWRQFPVISNRRWYHENRVLVGDALHTAHYSIGSGTRLALEDVIALVKALEKTGFDISRAFPKYQSQRQAVLGKLTDAALKSAQWYEHFAEHMNLSPWEFAYSYITRSGRISSDKLRKSSPKFASELEIRGIKF